MYALGVNVCTPELIAYPCVDVVTPETAIEELEVKLVDVCMGFIWPVGKNILELVDAKPTVGIGGSGNIVGGVGAPIFGIAMDAEVDEVMAIGLLLALIGGGA